MSVMIQLRNVPEHLHRKLKARAALAGRSLSDYLLRELEEAAAEPTFDEWLAELERDPPVDLPGAVTRALYESREERETALAGRRSPPRPSRRARKR